ncbi:fibronectin type III domain-containing protein [Flavobacterium sp. Fl-77]|uniref:Fibronectin type III domain-containing protein n=1 Tax=Flavobacterium flavipigmentatum TaxID=2893884 RepID=A0AAJ2S6E0_9FLAO|nr:MULTISPECIES: fibronectin type III domain-containing protein [unclassified Flavobacterium]MDX6181608.1 fibronectin type III domain-containing protein [Flavobacterium sp. Fl-33]MDX6185358.1 fibronectin type III domain-containing protein [Flavobacterium sp. Fl-77]UFH37462.1 fibronectin type III domain-containing protein [Flavobacterium sp. F-70]
MDKPQVPKMLKKLHLLVFIVCSFIGWSGHAQTFPVTISTQITQPSPIYLSNYADATTINSPIKIQVALNDLTISNRQVRLKFYFQGNSISFATNDFVVGARPLYLEGGFPLQLTNVDLAPYFEFQNILGLNPNQYAQPLPEGIYNFSVEVYDFATNKKLSKKTSVTTIIFQNEPPFLNLPLNNASIMQSNIQNIVFSWTPRSINVSNVEYEFSLVEIWDNYTPVQNAFAYSPPLYTTTTRNTTLQYGINQPQLIPGKKYAWRIKAKAILGAEEIGVFKNNGYSEIFSFNYEVSCTAPLSITTTGVSENQAKVTWSGNIDNYDYQVNYREKNANSEWYKIVTPRESATISNLKPNATYEYTVGASCDVGKYIHSTIHEFTTLAQDEIAFAGCGIKPDPKDLANKNPLPQLFPNDVVTAGDFPIVVLKATGNNGNFTGEGYVTLPFLEKFRKLIDAADALGGEKINIGQFSRIRITFNNIGVNTDFKLISGEIVASYDPDWKGMADLDGVVNDAFGDAGNVVNHQYDLSIKSVVKNPDGSITVTSSTGVTSVIEKTVNDIVITDKDGKQFAVPANALAGDIKQTGQLAPGGIPTSKNTNGMGSGGDVAEISSADVNVVFSKGDGKYAFDTAPATENGSLTKTYQTIPQKSGGTYKVNYKAISDNPSTDVVVATVDFKNGKTKKDLVFKTQNGTAIDSTQIAWKDNVATLTLKKTLDFAKETIIATVKPATPKDPKEAAGKYDIAGTIDLWHLTNKKVNVTLVSVNKATIPSNAQKQLNEIYEPAGITFNVNTIDVTLDNIWGESIQTSESGLLATYTDEQQQITANLKQKLGADYKKDTYYIIYTDAPSDKSNILGFMPLKRQYGFIFNKNNIVRTLAHELGHGVFGLQHPFTEYNTSTTTNLLMDYGTGVVLSHNDWQVLHAPGLQLYPFIQGDQQGESYWTVLDDKFLNLDKDSKDKTKGSFSFLSYHGEIVTLNKATLEQILFNYGTSDYQLSGEQAPGILQSFIINTNGTRTVYTISFNDGKYKDEKGTPYQFPDIKPTIIDGVIAFIPCGADGKTYKFKKSNLSTYTNANAKANITAIDAFPFVPFSTSNPALVSGGLKISQSFKLSDEGLRWSYDQDTADMTKNYCEKPELFYILKIAQIRKNYPEAFDAFTDIKKWENPEHITENNGMREGGVIIKKAFQWTYFLDKKENAQLRTDYLNKVNLDNYFKIMYRQFATFIQIQITDSDGFWAEIQKKNEVEIVTQVEKESVVQLEKRTPEQKETAIKTLIKGFVVESKEDAIIKLIASFTKKEITKLENLLINDIGLKTLDSKFDNFLGKENFTKIMTTVAGISPSIDPTVADSKTAIAEGKIIKIDNSIFFNETSDGSIDSKNIKFSKDTYTTYPTSSSYNAMGYSVSKENFLTVPYNQLVFVEFASQMSFNGVDHPKGDIVLVPAIVAYALINNANTEQLQKTSWLLVDGVLFATGAGEIKIFFTAGNWVRKIIVSADLIGSGANLLLDAGLEEHLPPDIARKCRIAGLLLSIPNGLLALRDLGGPLVKEFRAARAELKSAKEAEEFEKRIVSFEKQIVKADEAAALITQMEKISEKVPVNLREQFIKDFANPSEEILQALSKENSELINGWKKFRKNNPTTILCQ